MKLIITLVHNDLSVRSICFFEPLVGCFSFESPSMTSSSTSTLKTMEMLCQDPSLTKRARTKVKLQSSLPSIKMKLFFM